jgi:hypothetical protein
VLTAVSLCLYPRITHSTLHYSCPTHTVRCPPATPRACLLQVVPAQQRQLPLNAVEMAQPHHGLFLQHRHLHLVATRVSLLMASACVAPLAFLPDSTGSAPPERTHAAWVGWVAAAAAMAGVLRAGSHGGCVRSCSRVSVVEGVLAGYQRAPHCQHLHLHRELLAPSARARALRAVRTPSHIPLPL